MYCEHCGKEVSDTSKFCLYCGKSLKREPAINETAKSGTATSEAATSGTTESASPVNDIPVNDIPVYDTPANEASISETAISETAVSETALSKTASTEEPQEIIKKKKRLIPKIIMAVVLVGAVTFGAIWGGNYVKEQKQERFKTELRRARRYLSDLKYEQAVVSYQAAINIDPKNPKPYIGIADALVAMGDYDSAIDYLKKGHDLTGDKDISKYLDELEEAIKSVTKIRGMVISEDEAGETVGMPIDGASVHLEKKNDPLFRKDTETDENGSYEFSDLHPGKYNMVITADDYLKVEQVVDVYPGQEESYNPVVMMISRELSGEGTASGCIIDALTGFGVDGLTLELRQGYNTTQGITVAKTETNNGGYYTTPRLKAGYYTIEIVDERKGVDEPFLRSYINVRIVGDRDTVQQNGSVSTKLIEGQVRIVMSWGATPSDLDSHLFCIFDNGERHMNYFGNRDYYDGENGERIVDLDLDDTDSYGPETTTIYSNRPGEYVFGVYNFSHGYAEDLKNSQAMVQVYLGNSSAPAYVFYVPQVDGYFWEVFRYNGNTKRITPVNQMYDDYWGRDYFN